jgi:uncharacterized protein
VLANPFSQSELDQFRSGIEQFNERRFFECHETLERIWLKHDGEVKELLQGLIQLSVAYHHMLKGNEKGALKLLNRGLTRVAKYQPSALGLALSDLCRQVESSLEQLQNKENLQTDTPLIPRVRYL